VFDVLNTTSYGPELWQHADSVDLARVAEELVLEPDPAKPTAGTHNHGLSTGEVRWLDEIVRANEAARLTEEQWARLHEIIHSKSAPAPTPPLALAEAALDAYCALTEEGWAAGLTPADDEVAANALANKALVAIQAERKAQNEPRIVEPDAPRPQAQDGAETPAPSSGSRILVTIHDGVVGDVAGLPAGFTLVVRESDSNGQGEATDGQDEHGHDYVDHSFIGEGEG
jgi:hypothetical protein